MKSHTLMRGLAICTMATLIAGAMNVAGVRAASEKPESLIYAVYNGQNTANDVFTSMIKAQGATGERIESYAVVSKGREGKVRVRDQRKTDAGVGA
jgi:hypothetical protein